jgi:hypothetical protein
MFVPVRWHASHPGLLEDLGDLRSHRRHPLLPLGSLPIARGGVLGVHGFLSLDTGQRLHQLRPLAG